MNSLGYGLSGGVLRIWIVDDDHVVAISRRPRLGMDELPDLSASQETLSLSLEESRWTFSRKIIQEKIGEKK